MQKRLESNQYTPADCCHQQLRNRTFSITVAIGISIYATLLKIYDSRQSPIDCYTPSQDRLRRTRDNGFIDPGHPCWLTCQLMAYDFYLSAGFFHVSNNLPFCYVLFVNTLALSDAWLFKMNLTYQALLWLEMKYVSSMGYYHFLAMHGSSLRSFVYYTHKFFLGASPYLFSATTLFLRVYFPRRC